MAEEIAFNRLVATASHAGILAAQSLAHRALELIREDPMGEGADRLLMLWDLSVDQCISLGNSIEVLKDHLSEDDLAHYHSLYLEAAEASMWTRGHVAWSMAHRARATSDTLVRWHALDAVRTLVDQLEPDLLPNGRRILLYTHDAWRHIESLEFGAN